MATRVEKQRVPGMFKDQFTISPDFDEPLPKWECQDSDTPEKRKQEPKPGSTYHAPGCDCGFCKMGDTRF
jgi:hypothetical protein